MPSALRAALWGALLLAPLLAEARVRWQTPGNYRFRTTGLTEFPILGEDDLEAVSRSVADILLAALEIGAPLVGALLLAEVAMAIAARFTPQANIFMLGLPLKALMVFLLMGNILIHLPLYTERISTRAIEIVGAVG